MRRSIDGFEPNKICLDFEKKRYRSLHIAVQEYQKLNSELGLRLFESTKHTKKESSMLFKIKLPERKTIENDLYRDEFINRKKRRKVLGIDDADFENHSNMVWGRKETSLKRKKQIPNKKKIVEVSEHVKGKFNVKGFAAKIEHNLAKTKPGVKGWTKMINTDLVNYKDTGFKQFETQETENNEPFTFFVKSFAYKRQSILNNVQNVKKGK